MCRTGVENGKLAFSDGENVYVLDLSGNVISKTHSVTYSQAYHNNILLTWACGAFLLFVGLWLVAQLFKLLRGMPFSEARRRMLIASASVLVTVILVMAFLFSFVQKQMQNQIINSLSQLAESISVTSDETLGERFAAIQSLDDYRDEDYNEVRAYMDAFCNASYHNSSNLYYVLYRFDNTHALGCNGLRKHNRRALSLRADQGHRIPQCH